MKDLFELLGLEPEGIKKNMKKEQKKIEYNVALVKCENPKCNYDKPIKIYELVNQEIKEILGFTKDFICRVCIENSFDEVPGRVIRTVIDKDNCEIYVSEDYAIEKYKPDKKVPIPKSPEKISELGELKLFKNQQEVYEKFLAKKYIYLKAGTGWGKSYLAMKAISNYKGSSIIFAPAHLLKQWSSYLKEFKIEHSVNEFGAEGTTSIWSVQKITRMFKDSNKFYYSFKKQSKNSLFILDEFHRILGMGSNIYDSLTRVTAASYIFLSATPLERNISDLYPALRINSILNIKQNWGPTWRSVTEFKRNHCIMGGFQNKIIERVTILAKEKILSELTIAEHTGIENELVETEVIKVDASTADQLIRGYREEEEYHYNTARTILNGFRYKDDGFEKTTEWLFETEKTKVLKKLIKKQKGKALLFYDFTAEKEIIKDIPGIEFYHKTKFTPELFEKSDAKVMAVHYKSLGEGVRIKFVDTIYMFTISISNRMRTQAVGRAIYAGRTKKIKEYLFTTNTSFESSIVYKLDSKYKKVEEVYTELKNKS